MFCCVRMDLIPFYSRLVATLSPCINDVAPTLLEILLHDIRYQIRKKDQVHIHTKLKNMRLLGEFWGVASGGEWAWNLSECTVYRYGCGL